MEVDLVRDSRVVCRIVERARYHAVPYAERGVHMSRKRGILCITVGVTSQPRHRGQEVMVIILTHGYRTTRFGMPVIRDRRNTIDLLS